jgi:hypothetical protein
MNLEFHSSKSPNSQTIWVKLDSLEALTRLASSSPSPKSGRGFYGANTNQVFGISSLNCRHTTQHQNSLLSWERRVGDERGRIAGSSFKHIKAVILLPSLEARA